MLKSMTGFGTATVENADYKVTIELKAVNQRFLELNFHIGRQLSAVENAMREVIKEKVARGKLDIYINFVDKRENAANVQVNKGLVLAYKKALDEISELTAMPKINSVIDIANVPDVLSIEDEQDIDSMKPLVLEGMLSALEKFNAMRIAEGQNIEKDFLMRLEILSDLKGKAEKIAPAIVSDYREKLTSRLQELLAGNADETRIIEETAIFADKVNYTEEVVRLGSHFKQFSDIIVNAAEPVGRKLDFLVQEINRETNTIGSKANKTEVAQIVVDMKCELEKLREQIQNIE